jgi:quinol monooxygenase YgiN
MLLPGRRDAIRVMTVGHEGRCSRMGDQIAWVVELAVKPGELDNFRALMNEMVEATRAESGTLIFEFFGSEDGTVVHVYERFADSAAALTHLRAFGPFVERYLAAVDPGRFTFFGDPSAEVRQALGGSVVTYMGLLGGFAR